MSTSEQSKQIILEFLGQWWHELSWQAHETLLGTQLPRATPEQLYDSGLGSVLQQIASAAEGLLSDSEELRGEVHEACQQVAEWMWARPGMPSAYNIPAEWWATPLGNLVLRALLWAENDELLTVSEAAELVGLSVSAVSQWIVRGKLTAYRDLSETNPQRQTRVRRSEVASLR